MCESVHSFLTQQSHHGLAATLFILFITVGLSPGHSAGTTGDNEKIPYRFALEPTLPGAIVFNVDEILWPFRVNKVMTPPLREARNKNEIRDRMGKVYALFNETRTVLEDLFKKWYKLGGLVISTDPEKIENIMNLYDIDRFFRFFEVFPRTPGCKVKHMKRMSERLDIPLDEILYFDADEDQVEEVEALKVTVVKVSPHVGLTYEVLQRGLLLYHQTHNISRPYIGFEWRTEAPPDLPFYS